MTSNKKLTAYSTLNLMYSTILQVLVDLALIISDVINAAKIEAINTLFNKM